MRTLRDILIALAVMTAGLMTPALAAESPATGLDALKSRIVSGELPNVHSVLIIQDGRTLAEWYFTGRDEVRGRPASGEVAFNAETIHDVRSISKSIVSLLFGIALAEGKIKSLDEPVLNYFPEYADLRTPERMRIRLRDLLSMTSGLKWDEDTYPYSDIRNSETAMDMVRDRDRYILSQDIVAPPGERFTYSGGSVALIATVLKRATGQSIDDYAQTRIFRPLGITHAVWLRDDKGIPYAASGARMTPREMATIGQMVLDHGRWRGRQVVPAAWIADAISPHAQVQPDLACGTRYGYYWWLGPGCAPAGMAPVPWIAGIGNGGQRIWIIPSRRLVVVSTVGLYNSPRQGQVAQAILLGALAATTPPPPR